MVNSGLVFLVASPVQHKYFSSQAGLSTSSLNSLRGEQQNICHEGCTSPWQSTRVEDVSSANLPSCLAGKLGWILPPERPCKCEHQPWAASHPKWPAHVPDGWGTAWVTGLEPRIIAPKWAYVSSVQETQALFWPAYLGADSPDVLDYGNCCLWQLEPGRNEISAGIAGACAELGQLTAALQSPSAAARAGSSRNHQ